MDRRKFLQNSAIVGGAILLPFTSKLPKALGSTSDEEDWEGGMETVLSAKLSYIPSSTFLIEFLTEDDSGLPIPLDETPHEFPFEVGHKNYRLIGKEYFGKIFTVLDIGLMYNHFMHNQSPIGQFAIVLRTEMAYGHWNRFRAEVEFEYGNYQEWFIDFNYNLRDDLASIPPGNPQTWTYRGSCRPPGADGKL